MFISGFIEGYADRHLICKIKQFTSTPNKNLERREWHRRSFSCLNKDLNSLPYS